MKNNKNDKIAAFLYIVAAVTFFLSAMVLVAGDIDSGMAFAYLCFGVSMLCLGSVWLRKSKKPKEGADEDKGEQDGVE